MGAAPGAVKMVYTDSPMTTKDLLREREKELACIYSICLIAASAPGPEAVARGIAEALCGAMSRPNDARCRVEFANAASGEKVSITRGFGEAGPGYGTLPSLSAALPPAAEGWSGNIELSYADPEIGFLPQEKSLLDSVLVVAASVLRTANLIRRLRDTTEGLASKNTALREVLSSIEQERAGIAEGYRERLASDILPLVERAQDPTLDEERRADYLALLADEVERQMAAMGRGPDADPSLSPREREIAVQVRNGRTSKEIAELLGIAEATVERHRHNLRRKLKMVNRKLNLASRLSLDE